MAAPVARRSEIHTVEAADIRLRVTVAGAGSPLVLVHGWAMDQRVFLPQVAELAREFRVLTFDRRGFGLTGGMPDLARETGDIDAIADALIDEERFHLLGMSQGGRIAARYAAEHPARLRSLILQGAAIDGVAVDGPADERIPIAEYVELARAGRMDEVRRRWLRHPMLQLGAGGSESAGLLREMLADYNGQDLVDYRPGAYDYDRDVIAALASAGLPVLMLTGAAETVARRRLAALVRTRVPGAREVLLEASGHLGNLSEPEAYNRAVADFCREVDGRSDQSGRGAAN